MIDRCGILLKQLTQHSQQGIFIATSFSIGESKQTEHNAGQLTLRELSFWELSIQALLVFDIHCWSVSSLDFCLISYLMICGYIKLKLATPKSVKISYFFLRKI